MDMSGIGKPARPQATPNPSLGWMSNDTEASIEKRENFDGGNAWGAAQLILRG